MSLHVVIDYYDESILQKLPNKTAHLTTLFQSTGLANGQQGFLNVTDTSVEVKFGSAVQVLQISSLIMPPGIENSNTPPAPKAAAPAPSKSKTPPSADSPSKSPSKSPPPESSDDKAPTSSKKASPPKASDSPPSPTPAAADALGGASASKSSGSRVMTSGVVVAVFVVVVSCFGVAL
ncbi:fasciclin-like arabinogalactan protein 3 [Papaver somniferum]|uniref:fasciclin-like arabinogalactan protein 3 n=1 Tax=Papaver somniferum TaxID=3469 RepID=UPI000E6FEDD5|nr:fasciclin-like arabinogalactan protein 3 [Papaver somniferum]